MVRNDIARSSVLTLFVAMVLSFFVAFNGQSPDLKVSMLAYAVVSAILIFFLVKKVFTDVDLVGDLTSTDFLIGVGGGLGLIQISKGTGLVTGIPLFAGLDDVVLFVAVVVVAPIVEEFLFRSFILARLKEKFNNFNAKVVQAVGFALFHLFVYGGILGLISSTGLFVSAGLVGLLFGFVVDNKNRTDLDRVIIMHAIFNFHVLNLSQQFFSIGIF